MVECCVVMTVDTVLAAAPCTPHVRTPLAAVARPASNAFASEGRRKRRSDFCKLRLGPHKGEPGRSAGSRTLGLDVRYADRERPHAKRKIAICGLKNCKNRLGSLRSQANLGKKAHFC